MLINVYNEDEFSQQVVSSIFRIEIFLAKLGAAWGYTWDIKFHQRPTLTDMGASANGVYFFPVSGILHV
jgi:hypothetical protein